MRTKALRTTYDDHDDDDDDTISLYIFIYQLAQQEHFSVDNSPHTQIHSLSLSHMMRESRFVSTFLPLGKLFNGQALSILMEIFGLRKTKRL